MKRLLLILLIVTIACPSYAKNDIALKHFDNFVEAYKMIKESYVDNVSDEVLINNAIKGMLQELDPYSTLMDAKEYKDFMDDMNSEFGGLGIHVGLKDNLIKVISPMEGTPAYKAGVKSGDIIYKIDNKSTAGMSLNDAVKLMKGAPKTKVTLTVIREGVSQPMVFNIVRDIIKVDAISSKMINNVGYIRLSGFKLGSGEEVRKALQSLDKQNAIGIILDLRGNPGGSLEEAEIISSLFLSPNSVIVSTKNRKEEHVSKSRKFTYRNEDKPLVVLVDGGSASASEIVAGAIKDNKRGIIMGTRTFGKASVQRLFSLNGNSAVKMTIARYYTPSKISIQDIGIEPDIEVAPGKVEYFEKQTYTVNEAVLESKLDNKSIASDAGSSANDLQLQSALQLIKGLNIHGNINGKK